MDVGLLMILYKKGCDFGPNDLPSSVDQSVNYLLTKILLEVQAWYSGKSCLGSLGRGFEAACPHLGVGEDLSWFIPSPGSTLDLPL
jgi:hypothetical protein